ncbi:MAG: NACHT domain-containing protein, partial [bacterium]|nr:NACHT domain-containing protein [bacterium]
MTVFTILHLSDIHFKKSAGATVMDVQDKLVAAVDDHIKKHKAPDYVAVTGDIVFSGTKEEYQKADEFFDKLKELLPDVPFLPVPGNHDLDRKKVKKSLSLHTIVTDGEADGFLEDQEDIDYHINRKFKEYRSFADRLAPSLYQQEGDYFWVKNDPARDVSFLGLNSAWACENEEDQGRIALGYPQLIHALKKAQCARKIVLMHHPPFNWLKDLEGKTGTELFKQCRLLLHGHIHSQRSMVVHDPDTVFLALGANASYTKDRDGYIGFQCIEIPSTAEEVTVWPYILDTRQNEVVPDTRRWKKQGGKEYFTIGTPVAKDAETEKTETPKPNIPLIISQEYKQWITAFHSKLSLDQLARKGEAVMVDLPKVYIPLDTTNPFYNPPEADERAGKPFEAKNADGVAVDINGEPDVIDVEELVGRVDCLLLRGSAGMGKTTIIKHLAYRLTHNDAPGTLAGFLPVLVFLKDLWPLYEKKQTGNCAAIDLESLLEDYFKTMACPLSHDTVSAFLAAGRALLLLDGLDEVPEGIRPHVIDMLHRFQFRHKANRFLITGRPHGIRGKGETCFCNYLRDLQPLDRKRSSDFIVRWFRAVSGEGRGLADAGSAALIAEIHRHERAEKVFTGNPLLLTALCVFYIVGNKRIPDQRADLYERIVDNLLYRRFNTAADTGLETRVLHFLMLLAYTMHRGNLKKMEACEAVELLREKNPQGKDETKGEYNTRLELLFETIEPQCGLLNRLSNGEVEFSHLSFQEFLAAKYMVDMEIDYRDYLDSPWWEEVVLLYTGLLNLKMLKKSNQIVEELLPGPPRICLLGATALRDFPADRREEQVTEKVRKEMIGLMTSEEAIETRFKAGEILGQIGDPRFDVFAPPMVRVEAGEFIMGSE